MKDEIKEILDKLKDNDWYEELDLTGTKWIELQQEETNQLLNYITNLQQENEHFRTELNTYKNAVYKIRNYINAYSPYFLQTQEENEIKTTKLNAIRKYLLNNKLYKYEYDDEELFEIVTDKKAKDVLLNILNGGDE